MAELGKIPRVIAALDTTAEKALELMDALDGYQQHVAIQLRGALLMAHGDCVVEEAQDRNFYTIANCHITDVPSKQSLDIDTLLIERDIRGRQRHIASALSAEPPISSSKEDKALIKAAIDRAHESGVAIIGTPRSYVHHPSDSDYFAQEAIVRESTSVALGFDALEVVYNGLDGFYQYVRNSKDARHMGQIIVSKTSQSLDGQSLEVTAKRAFLLGATSILLGDSIVKEGADDPVRTIETVLDAFEQSQSGYSSP